MEQADLIEVLEGAALAGLDLGGCSIIQNDPANAPRLPDGVVVPVGPDGRCFAHCCVAGQDPQEWLAQERHGDGYACDAQRVSREIETAQDFISTLRFHGLSAQRVEALESGESAESTDFKAYASKLGGQIKVTFQDVARPMFFGQGPLMLEVVQKYLGPNRTKSHYELTQSYIS